MVGRLSAAGLLTALLSISVSAAPVYKRNTYSFVLENPYSDAIFQLGNVSYLANTKHPKVVLGADTGVSTATSIPITVVKTNASSISKDLLSSTIASYLEGDDVFNYDFLAGLYISSSTAASMDASAIEYLASFNTSYLFSDGSVSGKGMFTTITLSPTAGLPAGPFLATLGPSVVSVASVYRLYADTYRTFLFGAYDSGDGQENHNPLGVFLPKMWDPMIP